MCNIATILSLYEVMTDQGFYYNNVSIATNLIRDIVAIKPPSLNINRFPLLVSQNKPSRNSQGVQNVLLKAFSKEFGK